MTDTLIIEKAFEEIQKRNFGITEQFLNVHEVVYADNCPKVVRIDRDHEDGGAIVYFPVKEEKFFLAIYIETVPEISVRWVDVESYNSVYFIATSEDFTLEQLSSLTKLEVTNGWNNGDQRKFGTSFYNFSAAIIEPNPEPDEFEDKLKKLLNYLEKDRDGTIKLVENANGCIQVKTVFYNGNTILGGHHLNKDIITRLSSLKLEIYFDLYAEGNFFQD